MFKLTEGNFVESKELREECMNRVEVLEKVKDLFLIPSLEMMTTKQVADYFEVDTNAVRKCFHDNRDEVEADGVKKIKGSEAVLHLVTPHRKLGGSGYAIQLADGNEVNISTGNTIYFSKRAILRIAMLLRDSEVAREVRTQLLNTFEHAGDEQRTADMTEEQTLYMNVGKAMASGDWAAYQLASVELIAFKNRHLAQAEEAIQKLQEEKKELAAVNSLLARDTVAIKEPRRLLIFLTNVYSRTRWPHLPSGIRMSKAYRDIYGVMLNSEPHIDLRSRQIRREAATMIDCIEKDEFCYAIAAVMSLILKYNDNQTPEDVLKHIAEIEPLLKEAEGSGCVVNIG